MLDAVLLLLPSGTRITESMLTPMTDEERAFTATAAPVSAGHRTAAATLDLRSAPELAALVDSAPASDAEPSHTQAATGGAYARTGDGTPRVPGSRRPMLLGAAAIAAIVGVVGLAMRAPGKVASDPPALPSAEAPVSAAVAPLPSASTPAVASASASASASVATTEVPKPAGKASAVGAPRIAPSAKAALSTVPPTPTAAVAPAKSAPAAASSSPISRDFN
jgi:hypothetical protein